MESIGTQTLESDRLILRKITHNDGKEIFESFRNQKEFLYYANKQPTTLENQIKSLEDIDKKYESLDYYNWLITTKSENKIIGQIFLNVNQRNESVMFSYAIDKRFTCQGYMTEALLLVKKFAFDKIKVHRFEGGCVVSNTPSKRVMEKCGLVQEGILKDYVKLADGFHDMIMFAEIRK